MTIHTTGGVPHCWKSLETVLIQALMGTCVLRRRHFLGIPQALNSGKAWGVGLRVYKDLGFRVQRFSV